VGFAGVKSAPLRIGFASIYAWRPHVEHIFFLATLARQAGHTCFFLTCDADLPACYTRELRDVRPDWQECLACRLGGIRSYSGSNVSALGAMDSTLFPAPSYATEWSQSSASTLGRFESDSDFGSPAFAELTERLAPSVATSYSAARAWIAREKLDAVCVFNGRIDATRAVFEAARDAGIRVLSLERTWFGDGLQLLPEENCLGLQSVHALMQQWRDQPLTAAQAVKAASYAAARFTRRNQKEWRAYNVQSQSQPWPVQGQKKILLLPGSRNEIWGHPDWQSNWSEPTAAYDAIMAHLGLQPQDMVLRCHPNWGEKIGKNDGHLPERYYTHWARQRGIHTIASTDSTSTMGLIEQCEAIVVASGSAALEAGILGKQVIATDPSIYQQAGFRTDASAPEHIPDLRLNTTLDSTARRAAADHIARMTLRFCYTMAHRVAQYAAFVKAQSSASYGYVAGADPSRFTELLQTGKLQADDATCAADGSAEDAVLATIAARDWDALSSHAMDAAQPALQKVRRRWFFRPLDQVRQRMPVGDR
jgi:hypothetical protein